MKQVRDKILVFIWLAVLIGSMLYFFTRANVVTDMAALMPEATTPVDRLILHQFQKGPASRLLIIGVSGASAEKLADISSDMVERLRQTRLFVYVNNGDDDASDKDREFVMKYRYLLSDIDRRATFSAAALKVNLQQQLEVMASPLAALTRENFVRDPTGESIRLLQLWGSGVQQPAKQQGVWFAVDGKRALIIAETKASSFALDQQQKNLTIIKMAFEKNKGDSKAELVISGPAVFAVEAKKTIRQEIIWLSGISTTLVIVFLLLIYRSPTLLLTTALPLLGGIVVAAAVVNAVFGQIHGITLAFGVTIIGVAVDYPIHLFTHRQAHESANITIKRLWPTLLLSVVTTAVGYSAMLLSGFAGLAELGLFAVIGLLTAALATYSVLPVLMGFTQARIPLYSGAISFMALTRPLKWLPLALIVLSLGLISFLHQRIWENDIANLSPASPLLKQRDQALRGDLNVADVSRMLILEADSQQALLEKNEKLVPELNRLQAEGVFKGYDLVTHYLPSRQQQLQRQRSLPTSAELQRSLTGALQGSPFRRSAFNQFVQEVKLARNQDPITLDDLSGTSIGLRLRALIFQHGDTWNSLIPIRALQKDERLQAWVKQAAPSGLRYLNLKDASNRIINHYRDEALWYVAIGFAVILILLLLRFRSIITLTRILLPIIATELTVVAILLLLGFKLSVFHIIGLLLVMGIGLDYSLFFNRAHENVSEGHRTTQSLLVCSATTVLVFGVLAFSQTPVLSIIGLTVAMGSLLCLLLSAAVAKRTWDYSAA